MKRSALLLGLLLATTVAFPAHAQTAGFAVTGGTTPLANPPFTLGYSFSATQAYSVSGLGFFDHNGDGLASSHAIGLWDAGGTLLASTTLSGTGGTLIDGFRYGAITQLLLGPGDYTLGALFADSADQLLINTTITPSTGLLFGQSRFAGGGVLTNPLEHTDAHVGLYFGPNLLGAAVPEPATWALLLLGFGAIGGALRSRRQKVAVTYA